MQPLNCFELDQHSLLKLAKTKYCSITRNAQTVLNALQRSPDTIPMRALPIDLSTVRTFPELSVMKQSLLLDLALHFLFDCFSQFCVAFRASGKSKIYFHTNVKALGNFSQLLLSFQPLKIEDFNTLRGRLLEQLQVSCKQHSPLSSRYCH